MADHKGVITVAGRRKLCMAHAGDAALPAITRMAWGNGGVDGDGQPVEATGNEVGLYQGRTTCRYTATLEAGELDGEEISEMGLYDAEGDLVAYRTFLRKGKDADIPQIYDMDEIF